MEREKGEERVGPGKGGTEADTVAPLQVGTPYAFYMRPAPGGAGIYSQLP